MDTPEINSEALASAQSQERIDAENLNMLTLCHSILGGLTALFSCLFIIHIVLGTMMIRHPSVFKPPAPPFMGYLFLTVGIVAVALGWTLGGLTAYAGQCLKLRKNYMFVLVTAGLNCAFVMPLGTVLGAFTFVVLLRPTVKALFVK